MSKSNEHISIGCKQMSALINGEKITVVLSNGNTVTIQESMSKDISNSIINRDKKVVSKSDISNLLNMRSNFNIGL